MKIEFLPITHPSGHDYELLLNDPVVLQHMPLHSGYMDAAACEDWAKNKASLWGKKSELGPWSIYIGGEFAGWGGLQPEANDEAGVGLVLHKRFWGHGFDLALRLFDLYRLNGGDRPISIMLPKSRGPHRLMQRYGLKCAGELVENGVLFYKFLLH